MSESPIPVRQEPLAPTPLDRIALVRLVALVTVAVALAWILHGFPVLIVIVALLLMVMGHEFGHFVTAKASGMKVTEFFLGFGPRLWSIRRGETEYGIKMIPAGGYVRIIGMNSAEEIAAEDEPRSYRAATFPRRILVAVAGSLMHIVMSFILLFVLFGFVGVPTDVGAQIASVSSFVGQRSPAAQGGVHAGDVIVSVDGHRYANPERYLTYIESRPGVMIAMVVSRQGHDLTLHLRPQLKSTVRVATPQGVERLAPATAPRTGVIGVEVNFLQKNTPTNPLIAIQRSGSSLVSLTGATFSQIGTVFSVHGLFSFADSVRVAGTQHSATAGQIGSQNSGQLLSIYGAVVIGAQAVQTNVAILIALLVAINLFVGVINLFPMLPLDGGHVVVACYERIRSRRGHRYFADVTKLTPVIALFVAFILIMGVAALYANIVQPVSLPGR